MELKEKYKYYAKKKRSFGFIYSNSLEWFLENVERYCGNTFDLWVDGVKIKDPQGYLNRFRPHTLEHKIVDMCLKEEELQNELDNANSKVSELSNRIIKAIEYIENHCLCDYRPDNLSYDNYENIDDELLEILKGSDK